MSKTESLKNVSEEFFREARKLEVRLDDYLKEEEAFVTEIRNSIALFKSLHSLTEKLNEKSEPNQIAEALALKIKCEEAFSKAIIQQGEAGHEGSHLLESYGALILALQKLENKLTAKHSSKDQPAVHT